MIDFLLKNPSLYRFYQKTVRAKYSEYDLIKFIFSKLEIKNIKILDLCCGDSYVLEYIREYVHDYLGVDNSDKYLNFSKKRWKEFNFLKLDLNNKDSIKKFKSFDPNFIFINGAIHHLDDETVKNINHFLNEFNESHFLSVDPINHKNGIINKLMIKLDRGKHIRTLDAYKNVMSNLNHFVVDDFYKMSFQNIFHYKNFDLTKFYDDWKNSLQK